MESEIKQTSPGRRLFNYIPSADFAPPLQSLKVVEVNSTKELLLQLTETLATTSAVLGHMQWKREGQSRQIALPLLTLGLRREPDGQRRFYCTSVYGKCWEPHEG